MLEKQVQLTAKHVKPLHMLPSNLNTCNKDRLGQHTSWMLEMPEQGSILCDSRRSLQQQLAQQSQHHSVQAILLQT